MVETENRSTGAARMRYFWKTPALFAKEQTKEEKEKTIEFSFLNKQAGMISGQVGT